MFKFLNKKVIFAIAVIAAIIGLRYTGLTDYLSLSFIKQNVGLIENFISTNYVLAVLAFIGIYILTVATSLPFTNILSIAAGYFFGIIPAVIYANIGAICGAFIAYMLFRYLLHDIAFQYYGDRLDAFKARFAKEGVSYLLFMQLLPITPFGVINILAGISGLPLKSFLLTTLIGITPGQFIYAFAGKQLNYVTQPSDILSTPVLIALGSLALLALLPLVLRKLKIIN
jgi:uncharacterized membrane protein YdjX (TVP38/TMEM64 family)